MLCIFPFLTITSIVIDQSIHVLMLFSSGSLFYLCDHSSLLCFLVYNSIIYFSFIFVLTYLLVIILCYSIRVSFGIIPLEIIGSHSSFYIPIYQDILLLLSCYFFKVVINLIECVIGVDSHYSLYHLNFISSFELINFVLLLLFMVLLD